MNCQICRREAADLLDKVDSIRDLLIELGAPGYNKDDAQAILGALYDLRLLREALDSGEGEDADETEGAAQRDLDVLQAASAERGRAGRVEG